MDSTVLRADVVKVKDERGRTQYRAAIRDIDYRIIWIHPSTVGYTAAMLIAQYKVRELSRQFSTQVHK